MRFVKPLDEKLLDEVFNKFEKILTVEDAAIMGGFGSAILEYMSKKGHHSQVKILGISDRIFEHGSQLELQQEAGFDPDSITDEAMAMVFSSYVNKK